MSCLVVPRFRSVRRSVKYRTLTFAILCSVVPVLMAPPHVSAAELETVNIETYSAKLRGELDKANEEIERLTALAEFSRVQFAAAQNKLKSTVTQLNTLVKVRGDGAQEAAELKTSLAAARFELERQKTKLEGFDEAQRVRLEAVQALANARAELNARTEELRKVRETGASAIGEAKQMRSDIDAANLKALALQAKLDAAQTAVSEIDETRSELQEARAKITSLTASATTTREKLDELQGKAKSAAAQIASLIADRKAALVDMSAAQKARDVALKSLAAAQAATALKGDPQQYKKQADKELALANDKVQAAITEAGGLRDSLKTANAKILTLETGLKDATSAAEAAQGLQAELKKAHDQIASLKSVSQTNISGTDALEGKLQTVTQQRDALVTEKKTAVATLAASKKALDTANQLHATAQKGANEKVAALEAKLNAANAAATKIGDVETELQGANAQLEKLTEENKAALTKLAAAELARDTAAQSLAKAQEAGQASAKETDDLKAQLLGAGEKVATLEAKLDVTSAAANKIADVEKELQGAKAQLAVLATEKKAALTKLAEAEQAQEKATQAFAKAQNLNAEHIKALAQAREEQQATLAETEGLRTELIDAMENLGAFKARLATVDAVAAKSGDLEKELLASRAKIASLSTAEQSSASKLAALGSELQAAETKMGDLTADKKDALSVIVKLKASLTTAETEAKQKLALLDELKQTKLELDKTAKTLAEVRAANSSQNEAVQAANEQVAAADAKAGTIRTALLEAEQKIKALTVTSDASSKQLTALKGELQATASQVATLSAERKVAETEITAFQNRLMAVNRESERRESDIDGIVGAFQLQIREATDALAKAEAEVKNKDKALLTASAAAKKSALEAEILGEKLTVKEREIKQNKVDVDTALAELNDTRSQISQRIEKLIELATAEPKAEYGKLQKKLRAVQKENSELKAKLGKKSAKASQ